MRRKSPGGEFIPNLINIARYVLQIWDKFSAKCEAHLLNRKHFSNMLQGSRLFERLNIWKKKYTESCREHILSIFKFCRCKRKKF